MEKELFTDMFIGQLNEREDREAYYAKTDKAMSEFTKGLARLSKKTGIHLEVTGSMFYDDPKTIKSVTYSDDFSSGDMSCDVTFK